MFDGQHVWVVMPMYNEASHVGGTLEGLPDWVDGVLVVDDGSDDGSGDRVAAIRDPRVVIHRHDRRLGVGAALSTGFQRVLGTAADIVVTMDADGQMAVGDLPGVLEPVASGRVDYAKGSRFHRDASLADMPWGRRWANRLISWHLARVVGDLRLRDAHCGYTAMARYLVRMLEAVPLHPTYGVYNDILARVVGSVGVDRVAYVPVETLYADERSHLRMRDAARLARLTWTLQRRHRRAQSASHPLSGRPIPAKSRTRSPLAR